MTEKFVLSCVSLKNIPNTFLSDIEEAFKKHHLEIQEKENLSVLNLNALDIKVEARHPLDHEKLKFDLMDISNKHQIDAAFMEDDSFRSNRRLIVFDMDSTLIQAEVIDEMAAVFGVGEKVKHITERAMNGELNFDSALRERVALLEGLGQEKMEQIFDRLPVTPGAQKLITTIRGQGYKTAIVSGGFQYFTNKLKTKLGIDYSFGNDLEIKDGKLTGKVKGEIINAQKKAEILVQLANQEKLKLEQVVAVGDGANDLLMLSKAGLGIAFHAKEKVRREARHRVSHGPLSIILYFLGIPGDHLDETV